MIVDSAHYKDGVRQQEEALTPERAAELRDAAGTGEFVWVGLREPSVGELKQFQKLFGLHELAVEDAQNAHQRPKIEDYDQDVFIILKTAHYHEDREVVHFGEIALFAGPGYVITVRHGPGSELASARRRLEARPDLLKLGATSAVWAVLDKVVDDYLPVAEAIEDDIEEVEKDVFDDDIPAPDRPHLQPEARGDRVPPSCLAAARFAHEPSSGRISTASPMSWPATSATSPTTPSGSTSRSAPSASC